MAELESRARPWADGHAVEVTDCRSAHSLRRQSTRRCRIQIAVVSWRGMAEPRGAKNVTCSMRSARPTSVESTRISPEYARATVAFVPRPRTPAGPGARTPGLPQLERGDPRRPA